MTEDRTGRELTPRPEETAGAVTPRESLVPRPSTESLDRFDAGEQAHTVGLTEERAAQIVKSSGNARMIAFLGVLLFVLFIPLYWLYDIGLPVIGFQGRLANEGDAQYVTDVKRGYALYLANCARCHDSPGGEPGNGLGNVGPALNDQAKLYNVLTEQGLPGNGHLNPDYLEAVLREGGRYVCGDPNSVMPAWLDPKGPLNYREIDDIIKFITASKDINFSYVPAHAEGGHTLPPPVDVEGWRDPAYSPAPDATPVPECWRAPAATGAPATAAPVANPGTPESPRVIEIEGAVDVKWVDPATDTQITAISVVEGETVEFHIINESTPHNFHIGPAAELAEAVEDTDLPGLDSFANAEQTFTWTVENLPEQPQFACTIPGHYPSMNGNFLIAQPGGSPAPSAGASPSTSPGPSPAEPAPASSPPAVSPPESPAPAPTQ
jgi:mono/diheme cytochrome c family protein